MQDGFLFTLLITGELGGIFAALLNLNFYV
jgi:hypothetical protein